MENIQTSEDLKEAIRILEFDQNEEWALIKQDILDTYESLKPVNIIKTTIKDLTTLPEFKGNMIGSSIGFTVGYISKAILIGIGKNPVKEMIGDVIQLGVANAIAKNQDFIKSVTGKIFSFFNSKKRFNRSDDNEE